VLEQALARYDGTVIMVSHDRAFMDRVVSKVLAFEGAGLIVPIEGGYSDFKAWKVRQNEGKEPKKKENQIKNSGKGVNTGKVRAKLSYKDQRELDALPGEIETIESEKADIEARFCDADYFNHDADAFREDQQCLAELEASLTAAYTRWEALELRQRRLAK